MREIKFYKKCAGKKLDDELVAANFEIYGVSTNGSLTIIHLKDVETKNPATIVNNHVYENPPDLVELARIAWKEAASLPIAERIEKRQKILAKYLLRRLVED